mgnify:CR=1 FL=1
MPELFKGEYKAWRLLTVLPGEILLYQALLATLRDVVKAETPLLEEEKSRKGQSQPPEPHAHALPASLSLYKNHPNEGKEEASLPFPPQKATPLPNEPEPPHKNPAQARSAKRILSYQELQLAFFKKQTKPH